MKTTTSVSFPLFSTRADTAENWLGDDTNIAGHILDLWCTIENYRVRRQTSRPFYELIYQTIRPEILSSLVANERSGSLLSGDVPGYEIWT